MSSGQLFQDFWAQKPFTSSKQVRFLFKIITNLILFHILSADSEDTYNIKVRQEVVEAEVWGLTSYFNPLSRSQLQILIEINFEEKNKLYLLKIKLS